MRKKDQDGFSLVEVVLALGVVSFAVLSMLGVMTVGLGTVKDASDQTMQGQIISSVSASILQTPFSEIDAFVAASPLHFDLAGRKQTDAAASLYRVVLEVSPGGSYPGAPGDLGGAAKTVRITVATMPPGAVQPLSTSSVSLIIPKS